jgi:hypothetical protein
LVSAHERLDENDSIVPSALPTVLAWPTESACPAVSPPPTELALPQESVLPPDHIEVLPSLLPVVSAVPVPVDTPLLDDSMDPLLSELDDDEPLEEDEESLPPTPALTLAEATPGTPPLTDPPAFQLSVWPEDSELLVPALVEFPDDIPVVFEAVLPEDTLSL